MDRERQPWLVYALGNLLLLVPGAFFMWLASLAQQAKVPQLTFACGLIGGGLLVWAFYAIGARREDR